MNEVSWRMKAIDKRQMDDLEFELALHDKKPAKRRPVVKSSLDTISKDKIKQLEKIQKQVARQMQK